MTSEKDKMLSGELYKAFGDELTEERLKARILVHEFNALVILDCAQVRIGDNVVVGSGSVVTKDIPANMLAAGNPCKVLREINEITSHG